MKIIPQTGPNVIQPPQATTNSPSSQAATRDRVIKMLETPSNQPQAQQHPVLNPSQVKPEELSAVSSPTKSQEAQTPNSDSATSVEAPEANPETKVDPLHAQYALLARREKALRAKAQAERQSLENRTRDLQAREDALKAKEAEYQSNYIPKDRLKADPLAALTETGVSYDEITQAIMNPRAATDPRILAEIERLKADVKKSADLQEQNRKTYEEQQKKSYQQAVNQIRNDTKQLVKQDPNFETIRETGSVNDVVELIERTFQKEGVLLTVEEAAKEVEEYLVEKAIKLASLSKVKSKLQSASSSTSPSPSQSETEKSQPQMKTLTNAVNASKKLSTRDRAILAFKNELK